jgi:RND superfamily putative drug exporter
VAVLALAASLLAASGGLYAAGHGGYSDALTVPGAESQDLIDLLKERFPAQSGDSAYVVIHVPTGVQGDGVAGRVEALRRELQQLPQVVAASSPYETPGQISPDGSIALISVQYAEPSSQLDRSVIEKMVDVARAATAPGFEVEAGGAPLRRLEMQPPGTSEIVGLVAAIIILLLVFGSIVAMGVPIVSALIALVSGFFLVGVAARFFEFPSFTPQFASMIGIGVGIDYALLIVTRFREGLGRGLSVAGSVAMAARTAGRSVLFAGSTVVIALLGLWSAGIPAVGYAGTAAALVVALAVLVAVFFLPALLRIVGTNIDRWQLPLLSAPVHASERGLAYRWSRIVQRYPIPCIVLSLALLLLMAAPVLDMRLGSSDAGNNPESLTSRRAYDLLARGFGTGFNGPIILGFSVDDGETGPIQALPGVLKNTEGVAQVSQPTFNADRSAAVITLIPTTAPQDEKTAELVHRLRVDLKQTFAGTNVRPFVGGPTALFIDIGTKVGARMPLFFGAVIGLGFLVLLILFRSLVVAVKAAIMNLLSIGASFGILVAIFQWGWLGGIVGVYREGPIESFMPMMLFAVLFGLSMDYEVFLVSRIREEYLKTGDNAEAVARGLSVTSRVISAAAAIMIAVFLAFAISDLRLIKEFGMGLAVAIFIDATLVRLVLVPAVMQVMGDLNWWCPRWLDRLIPRLEIEAAD